MRYLIAPMLALSVSCFNLGVTYGKEKKIETYRKVGYTEVMIACLDVTKEDQVLCAEITNRVAELKGE